MNLGQENVPNSNEQMAPPETISSAAIQFRGEIFTGVAHPLAALEMVKRFPDCWEDTSNEKVEGFLTSNGRFVSRHEADEIAIQAGQKSDAEVSDDEGLQSQDLH